MKRRQKDTWRLDVKELINIDSVKTMDSRVIAELVEKRHANVIRDIEDQISKLENAQLKFESSYKDCTGRTLKCYKLPYRETMILVSGYSVELRARVIDRWMELEAREAKKLPTTFAEALRLAADQAEQIELMKPKADTFDRISDATGLRLLSEVGKINGIGPKKIFTILEERGIIFKKRGSWVPMQEYQDAGYFLTRDRIAYTDEDGIDHMGIQTYVTPKGELWITKKLFQGATA